MVDEATPPKVQPRLASAVMLLRDVPARQGIEVFMVRRVIQSDFMPDVYVFPGGSVSADDRAAEQTEGVCMPVVPGVADPEGHYPGQRRQGRCHSRTIRGSRRSACLPGRGNPGDP